jgi:hypothetical protein
MCEIGNWNLWLKRSVMRMRCWSLMLNYLVEKCAPLAGIKLLG